MSTAPTPPEPGAPVPDDPGFAALDRLPEAREVTVRAAGRDLHITLDSGYREISAEPAIDREGFAALLPRLRALLADFDTVRDRSTGYLWEWGATGEEPPGERAGFLRDMAPTTLAITSAVELELHYEDMSGTHLMEGYWAVVRHDGAMHPVDVTIEA
ncbi:hypothetical protein AB0G74_32790 [Streptomyces sp. NPDC020875]|uniref:hypothetical protein n=1 Tax=Streptomyces sp. NPDC020875 TaxID=3154898 RepID=UPI0033E0514E